MSIDTDHHFSSLQFLESAVNKNDLIPNIAATGPSQPLHSQQVSNSNSAV